MRCQLSLQVQKRILRPRPQWAEAGRTLISSLSRPGRPACHTRQRGQPTAVWGKLFVVCVWHFTIILECPSRVAANMMPTAVRCVYIEQPHATANVSTKVQEGCLVHVQVGGPGHRYWSGSLQSSSWCRRTARRVHLDLKLIVFLCAECTLSVSGRVTGLSTACCFCAPKVMT